jgi:hypothetical protein
MQPETLGHFLQAGQAAQLAVDRAIERAELVRLVRDRGAHVRELAAVELKNDAWQRQYAEAITAHSRACAQLDEFDHTGRAPA